jgi:hypothetical protein
MGTSTSTFEAITWWSSAMAPQTLSATSLSLVMKQLEKAGYNREQLRRDWA